MPPARCSRQSCAAWLPKAPKACRCRWIGERGRSIHRNSFQSEGGPRPPPSASHRRHQRREGIHQNRSGFDSDASRREADWNRPSPPSLFELRRIKRPRSPFSTESSCPRRHFSVRSTQCLHDISAYSTMGCAKNGLLRVDGGKLRPLHCLNLDRAA
jgi:hypothetical protein